MGFVLGWLNATLVVALSGALVGTVIGATALLVFRRIIANIEPRRRLSILRFIAWLPTVLAAMVVVVAFYPTLFELLGIAADHCGSHQRPELHLCFVHYHPPEISPLVTGLSLGLLLFVGRHWWGQLLAIRRAQRWTEKLVHMAAYDEEEGVHVVDSDHLLAVTTGLLNRRIFVSEGLKQSLSPPQFKAVLAHEEAHRRRFDAVTGLLTNLFTAIYWPTMRRRLLQAIELAGEQCCDEAAASEVEDRLTVAEAILVVARGNRTASTPAGALCFGDIKIEKRVQALVDEGNWRRPSPLWSGAIMACFVALTLPNLHRFHHWIEHAVAWLT